MTAQSPAEGQEQATPEVTPAIVGLSGNPAQFPTGRWLAEVNDRGELVKRDGLLVRVR